MRRLPVLLLAILLGGEVALADGKFFVPRESVPAGEPYQRALLAFDGERECLVVQSQYELVDGAGIRELGWVVPVPAVPELGSFRDQWETYLFQRLDMATTPEVVSRAWIWQAPLVIGVMGGIVLLFLIASRRWGERRAIVLLAALCFILMVMTLMRPMHLGIDSGAVEVLKSERVGVYDVDVIRAETSAGLIDWLADRGFGFGEGDAEVVADYLSRGWCFVAARIAAEEDVLAVEGLADPLVLEFPTKEAVYPLALTGTAGVDTELLLYVLAPHRMDAPGLLRTQFAGRALNKRWARVAKVMEPAFLGEPRYRLPWLMKLKGTLTRAQMSEDLILTRAAVDEEHRDKMYVWH